MSEGRFGKRLHLASTLWFALCVATVLVIGLRQAGVRWWVLFSLSGYGLVVLLLLITLYLFAIFRGISSSQTVQVEHPLTCTSYYAYFYNVAPFLGGIAGLLGTIGLASSPIQFVTDIALGTLGTTFLAWVVIDPVVGVLETVLSPEGRRHRARRIAQAQAEARYKQQARERLMAEILAQEQEDIQRWRNRFCDEADRLAELLVSQRIDPRCAEKEALEIGVAAWREGGLPCMQFLREMAMEIAQSRSGRQEEICDFISFWWDGVGTWQKPAVEEFATA